MGELHPEKRERLRGRFRRGSLGTGQVGTVCASSRRDTHVAPVGGKRDGGHWSAAAPQYLGLLPCAGGHYGDAKSCLHPTLCTPHPTACTPQPAARTPLPTLHSTSRIPLCTLHPAPHIPPFTPHPAPHITLCTPHLTMHPTSCTPHPTLHPLSHPAEAEALGSQTSPWERVFGLWEQGAQQGEGTGPCPQPTPCCPSREAVSAVSSSRE